jgi:hypothetical protein
MSLISPELMEHTWRSVADAEPADVRRLQEAGSSEQRALTEYVLARATQLPPDAGGVALYTHVVLMEAFRQTKVRFRAIDAATVERAWKDNDGFVQELKLVGYGPGPFRIDPTGGAEPAALQYVIDALTESDPDDPVDIDEAAFWQALQLLKTVIDCMHDAAEAR